MPRALLVLVGLIAVVFFFFWKKDPTIRLEYGSQPQVFEKRNAGRKSLRSPTRLIQAIRKPLNISLQKESFLDIDRNCLQLGEKLLQLDFEKLESTNTNSSPHAEYLLIQSSESAFDLISELLGEFPCHKWPNKPEILQQAHGRFLNACGSQKGHLKETTRQEPLYACLLELFNYRLTLTEYFTKDIPIHKMTDKELVTRRFFAELNKDTSINVDRLISMATRLHEIDPADSNSIVLTALAHYLKIAKKQTEPGPHSGAFLDALEKWESAVPENDLSESESSLRQEMKLYSTILNKDIEGIRKIASYSLIDDPKDAGGENRNNALYYLAWAAFLESDFNTSKKYLEQIVTNDPSNERAVMTLNNFVKGNPNSPPNGIFHPSSSLSPEYFHVVIPTD